MPVTNMPTDTAQWSTRALITRHKLAAAVAALLVALFVGLFLAIVLGPRGGTVTGSTSCTQWSSSNQSEQQAYSERYLSEHGHLPSGGTGVPAVEAAINAGCMAAYASDEEDAITVLDAIERRY
jgi:hypothetical protein